MNFSRIIITGPESSGKTALAEFLSKRIKLPLCPEYAVTYLTEHGPEYEYSDLRKIAKGQAMAEDELLKSHPSIICDTSMLVLKVWSEVRFMKVDPYIVRELEKRKGALYLLCKPDLPWKAGLFRENPTDRDELYLRYYQWLKENNCLFTVISGTGVNRENIALHFLREYTHLAI